MRDAIDADALIIGAGPAGTATAILLTLAGWRVILVEQEIYPRQKVCGECLSAASLGLLDQLGVGAAGRAGPELRKVGWMCGASTLIADLPACINGPYRYGRALGRDQLDTILLHRATELGATLIQPGKVRSVRGALGELHCDIRAGAARYASLDRSESVMRRVRIVVDAHGSWERRPEEGGRPSAREPRHGSDLFGFKASFVDATIPQGLLPVISFPGGYGGLVIADNRRLTLAGCIRRDTLAGWRRNFHGTSAGAAFELYLRASCLGVRDVLSSAKRSQPWLSIGPIRPTTRLCKFDGVFSVGNAAGETHPLIGEGINMALQSAFLLAGYLIEQPARVIDATRAVEIHRAYRAAWRNAFGLRLRLAALFAHIAMRPALSRPVTRLLRSCPQLLTATAHLVGKDRRPMAQSLLLQGILWTPSAH